MKDLLMQLQNICNELKDESEKAIIKKYSQNAKQYTIAVISKTIFFSLYTKSFFI